MISFLLGIFSTIALSVAVDLTTGGTTHLLRKLRRYWFTKTAVPFDARRDELFTITEWSPARMLSPQRLLTRTIPITSRPLQQYVDPNALQNAVQEVGGSGKVVYLSGVEVDHRESEETQACRVLISESEYSEVRGIERIRLTQPDLLESVDAAVASDVRNYLAHAVPSSIAMNIIPITQDMDILCAERSSAVDNAIGCWTVGIFETMKRSDPNIPGSIEDIYTLAIRGLREELGLLPHEFGPVMITWLGIYRPLLRGHIVAIVRLNIDKSDAQARARESDSSYEHISFDWIPLRRSVLQSFLNAPYQQPRQAAGALIQQGDRLWIEQARLALVEAWRFRVSLFE
ncbi:hypothetical protein [Streptomyces sp. NBC_00035]|uniref:hypothetical protein n=1 Tax=Streptomyces sp. NBC_00035 TaxID=2903614 RepID=UPI003246241A